MQKYVSLALIATLMGMSFIDPVSVSARLPRVSNVYPDTFAIYWQFDKRYSVEQKENIHVAITVGSIYGDGLFEVFNADDSLVFIPFNPEYIYESALFIKPRATKEVVTTQNNTPDGHVLKLISKNDKLEALIALVRTSSRFTNLVMLAGAYEEEGCFANAYYIYKRMLMLYPQDGATHWEQFYERHRAEFTLFKHSR
jgi:hypothetical protein